ncbi:MAG: TerB family tellurite resistance protein [Coleofasciculus sp. G1-WW12-02]|uniref:TerB family tellurite resistance protein n=1 Tax=unclassified Coleofasciculus TaxID=2692782 RepID=UPI0032FD1536
MTTNQIDAARQRTVNWYYQDVWGWQPEEIPPAEVHTTFLKAQLIAANGDGTLTNEERQWALGRAAACGYREELLQELETYPANEDIVEVLSQTQTTNKSRKAVIYFTIKVCAADGVYHDKEKKVVRQAAAALGIAEDVVKEIEKLCAEEERLKQQRIQLLFPDGSPVHD